MSESSLAFVRRRTAALIEAIEADQRALEESDDGPSSASPPARSLRQGTVIYGLSTDAMRRLLERLDIAMADESDRRFD